MDTSTSIGVSEESAIAVRDFGRVILYLKAHGMSYYGIAQELNSRSPYRQSVPTDYRQVQRYEAGTRPIWDDALVLIKLYEEYGPEEIRATRTRETSPT